MRNWTDLFLGAALVLEALLVAVTAAVLLSIGWELARDYDRPPIPEFWGLGVTVVVAVAALLAGAWASWTGRYRRPGTRPARIRARGLMLLVAALHLPVVLLTVISPSPVMLLLSTAALVIGGRCVWAALQPATPTQP